MYYCRLSHINTTQPIGMVHHIDIEVQKYAVKTKLFRQIIGQRNFAHILLSQCKRAVFSIESVSSMVLFGVAPVLMEKHYVSRRKNLR